MTSFLKPLIAGFTIVIFSLFSQAQPVFAQDVLEEGPVVSYVNAAQAQALIETDSDIIILDVRTKMEYNRGHIEGAVLNNYYSFKFKKRLRMLDRTKHYIVHCKSGHRSQGAVKRMLQEGFTQITHLDGGYDAWKKLPAIKPQDAEVEDVKLNE